MLLPLFGWCEKNAVQWSWRVDQTTGIARVLYHDARRGALIAHEGVDFSQSQLRWLIDENDGGAGSKYVNYFTPTMGSYGANPPLEGVGPFPHYLRRVLEGGMISMG